MDERLTDLTFDEALSPGAHNAVRTGMRVSPEEKTIVITDLASLEIAASLARELETIAPRSRVWALEDLPPRPLIDMPRKGLSGTESSHVSIFAVYAQQGDLRSRMQITGVVNRRKMRHARMVNIEKRIMLEGMRADFLEVNRISQQVWELASKAKQIRATTEAGTAISENKKLEPEFRDYCHTDENCDRAEEFAIGTNIGVRDVTGNILEDKKIPGIHIAFGKPDGAHTGDPWTSNTHIDIAERDFDIRIDDRHMMHRGEFLRVSLVA